MTASTASNGDGLPPTSDEERSIIGCAIIDRDCAAKLFKVRPQFFRDPLHKQIMAEAERQYSVDQTFDPLRIGKALRGNVQDEVDPVLYLGELATNAKDSPSAIACFDARLAEVIKAARKHTLYSILDAGCEAALNGKAPEDIRRAIDADLWEYDREAEADKPREKFKFRDLRLAYPRLHPPVVDGLFREGETVNIIAPSKYGKSWLAYYIALCIITGRDLFDKFSTSPSPILYIDNELHRPTLAHRVVVVAEAMGLAHDDYELDLDVWALRGNLRPLHVLAPEIETACRGDESEKPVAVIYDSKYRFQREGTSENDNAEETQIYNLLDWISDKTGVASILIHHSSKGSQSDKRVTDVGAGAGAQSRAADCHIILREHEEDHVTVLDAALRSFPQIAPLPLRWCFPLWQPATDIDPAMLKGKQTATEQRQAERDKAGIDAIVKALTKGPATARGLRALTGFGKTRQDNLINKLLSEGHILESEITIRGNLCHEYRLAE